MWCAAQASGRHVGLKLLVRDLESDVTVQFKIKHRQKSRTL